MTTGVICSFLGSVRSARTPLRTWLHPYFALAGELQLSPRVRCWPEHDGGGPSAADRRSPRHVRVGPGCRNKRRGLRQDGDGLYVQVLWLRFQAR